MLKGLPSTSFMLNDAPRHIFLLVFCTPMWGHLIIGGLFISRKYLVSFLGFLLFLRLLRPPEVLCTSLSYSPVSLSAAGTLAMTKSKRMIRDELRRTNHVTGEPKLIE